MGGTFACVVVSGAVFFGDPVTLALGAPQSPNRPAESPCAVRLISWL